MVLAIAPRAVTVHTPQKLSLDAQPFWPLRTRRPNQAFVDSHTNVRRRLDASTDTCLEDERQPETGDGPFDNAHSTCCVTSTSMTQSAISGGRPGPRRGCSLSARWHTGIINFTNACRLAEAQVECPILGSRGANVLCDKKTLTHGDPFS